MHLAAADHVFVLLAVGSEGNAPWKNTSRLGHISSRLCFPVFSSICLMSTSIQDGTPERLLTFAWMVSRAMASILGSKCSIKAVCLLGTRTKFTSGLIFSMRMAERSPTRLWLVFRLGAWLPPRISLYRKRNDFRDSVPDRWQRHPGLPCNACRARTPG